MDGKSDRTEMPSYPADETSWTLLARIRSGERQAWERLTRLYGPLVRYWCTRWGVPEADLDDLSQEVWLGLGPTLAGYRAGPDRSFRGWLRGVTRHKTQDWFRRHVRLPAEAKGGTTMVEVLKKVESDVDIDVDDSEERAEYQALYRRALLELRGEFEQRTWQAFLATALEGKNATEVAKDLGLTPAAVRKAKSRVLGRLRAELGELSTGQQS